MKRLSALAAAVLAAALLLTACGGEQQPVETTAPPEETPASAAMPFSLPYYENASLHPITGNSQTNRILTPLVYQGLFRIDNEFKASAVLAKTWQRDEEGLVWTIKVREAEFSDGSALSGEDVAASLKLAKTSSFYASRLSIVKSVSAEENTVTITLNQPHGALPLLLDVPVVRERETGLPLGTGRYAFGEADGGLTLEGTEKLPEGLPGTILLTPIQGGEDLIYAFDTKEISLAVADLTGSDTLGFSGGYEIWDHPTTTMLYMGFCTDSGICRDGAVRQAISCALDRENIVNTLYARHARAAVLPVSPVSEYYEDGLPADGLEYTIQYGAALLEKAGYSLRDGILYQGRRPVKLTLIVSNENSFRLSAAEYIAGELGKLGLNVTVEKLPWQDYVDRLTRGEFDLYLAETMLTADFDLSALLSSQGALNYSRWNSEETDLLLDAFRSAFGEEREQAAGELYRHLQNRMPIAPICFKEQTVLTQWGQVTGLTPTRADCFFGDGWRVNENVG